MTDWQLPALMYHSASAVAGPLGDLAVPPRRLAEQLGALTSAGYRLTGLTEALDLLEQGCTDRLVAVTFDDGYRDFLTAAVPVLAETGAGATLYVSVGHLGTYADWLGPHATAFGKLLTWDELTEVSDAGVEIANHSLVHHPLDVLPVAQLREEVTRSKDELEQRLGRRVRGFAYPHGYNGAKVRAAVLGAGHDNATEVGRRMHTPAERRFAVPRFQPTPAMSGADLVAIVGGAGSPLLPRLKQAAQPGWRVVRRAARAAGRNLT